MIQENKVKITIRSSGRGRVSQTDRDAERDRQRHEKDRDTERNRQEKRRELAVDKGSHRNVGARKRIPICFHMIHEQMTINN